MKNCPQCGIPFEGQKLKVFCTPKCRRAKLDQEGPLRFWEKVDASAGPDGCWLYTGFRKWDGYGWLQRGHAATRRSLTAHRYAWILTKGSPGAGLQVLHRCDNPPCCNPAHLFLGTHADNMADRSAKGRAK